MFVLSEVQQPNKHYFRYVEPSRWECGKKWEKDKEEKCTPCPAAGITGLCPTITQSDAPSWQVKTDDNTHSSAIAPEPTNHDFY